MLMRARADPNAATDQGISPLLAGIGTGNVSGVRALLDNVASSGASLNLEQKLRVNSSTGLSQALYRGSPEMVEVLIRAGANRSFFNEHGGHALTDACQNPLMSAAALDLLCRQSRAQRDGAQEAAARDPHAARDAARDGRTRRDGAHPRGASVRAEYSQRMSALVDSATAEPQSTTAVTRSTGQGPPGPISLLNHQQVGAVRAEPETPTSTATAPRPIIGLSWAFPARAPS